MALSMDLRQRIASAYQRGEGSMRALATRFSVNLTTVRDLIAHVRETGEVTPKPRGGGAVAKLDASARQALRELVDQQSDATLDQYIERLVARGYPRVSNPTMSRVLRELGLPRKKSRSAPPNRTAPTSPKRARVTAKRRRSSTPRR